MGDELLIIDRQLEDKKGNLVGTFVSRCIIVGFAQGDLVVAFTATNKLNKGMINTQGAMRFADFTLPNGVTFKQGVRGERAARHRDQYDSPVRLVGPKNRMSTSRTNGVMRRGSI